MHGRNLPLQLLCRRPAGTILHVEASSTGKVAEVNATRTKIDRVEQHFAMKPARLAGGAEEDCAACLFRRCACAFRGPILLCLHDVSSRRIDVLVAKENPH
jgi:hypothetical protein